MNTIRKESVPWDLTILALLFLLLGAAAAIGMVKDWISGQVHIDLNAMDILAAFGLWNLSRGWRTYTLVIVWMSVIICPIGLVLGLIHRQPVWAAAVWIGIFLIALWSYRVLTRSDVRALFGLKNDPAPSYEGI